MHGVASRSVAAAKGKRLLMLVPAPKGPTVLVVLTGPTKGLNGVARTVEVVICWRVGAGWGGLGAGGGGWGGEVPACPCR